MTGRLLDPAIDGVEGGLRALGRVVAGGWLRCALPKQAGGDGASLDSLARAARHLAETDPAAALVLWAQRLAAEALAQSSNVGLREYVLPDLLSGERAGTLPFTLGERPIAGRFAGRGWRLDGPLGCMPNLQWVNCVVIAPLELQGQQAGWVLLRGEEDGLRFSRLGADEAPPHSRSAWVQASHVFFREDEWLGGAEFQARLAPVADALAPALSCWPGTRAGALAMPGG